LALAGSVEESLAAMKEALRWGFSPMMARTDEDLIVLRERPEFQTLVAGSSENPSEGEL
jgi:hypothetical protein